MLRPPVRLRKYGPKLKVVLKCRAIYTKNLSVVSVVAGSKTEGIPKWRDIKSQRPLNFHID